MPSSWSGRRNLVGSDEASSITSVSDMADSVQRRLYTSLPPWCSYVGVTCDTSTESSTYASVNRIDLGGLQLAGSLPSSIGSLTSLSYLALYSNSLAGTIPSSIGSLTSLQYLYLFSNQLAGTIPSSIGSMTSLQYLFLSSNSLTGTIPSSIGSM